MIITSRVDSLAQLKRLHQFIKHKQRGSRDEIAERLGVGKNKLYDMIYLLRNHGAEIEYDRNMCCYYYLNDFEFFIGVVRARDRAAGKYGLA